MAGFLLLFERELRKASIASCPIVTFVLRFLATGKPAFLLTKLNFVLDDAKSISDTSLKGTNKNDLSYANFA